MTQITTIPSTSELLLLGVYFAVLVAMAVYGLHRLFIVWLFHRHRRSAPVAPAAPEVLPSVTVQLPIFNERYVVEGLLDAVARIDYPRHLLEVQVLDDSTDDTRSLVSKLVARLREEGLDIIHLHRTDRVGFKAGALEAGLERARGELICVFDADFLPPPTILLRMLPHFADSRVGMVQARWEHLNREYSLLSRMQAIQLDAHFAVEHAARNRSGRFFNFNGTAGIWRRIAIEDAGGWQHDTLTEDLDLSYRAQVKGWRFVYVNEVEAPAELPVEMRGFKNQRHRWTKGAVQTARKMLARIWRSDVPVRAKVEATFHLTANINYPLNLLLAALIVPAMMVRLRTGSFSFLLLDVPIFLLGTGSVCIYYLLAQRELGRSTLVALINLPVVMAIDASIALNNTVAVVEGFGSDPGEFVRTPKFSAIAPGERWHTRIYRGRGSWMHWAELLIGVYFTVAVLLVARAGLWPAVPFLMLYQCGYLYTAVVSIAQRYTARPLGLAAAIPSASGSGTGAQRVGEG
jgi:cellulose synthase/poly-beta-1,6-N-acetylglucosamine synthase-like glycosyltransferase